MLEWNKEKVLENVREASTEDLLHRVTAYREGMESAAVDMIERELSCRGVTNSQIARRAEECQRECVFLEDGTAAKCSFCHNPAVIQAWGWHRLWKKVPLFPRRLRFCKEHANDVAGFALER